MELGRTKEPIDTRIINEIYLQISKEEMKGSGIELWRNSQGTERIPVNSFHKSEFLTDFFHFLKFDPDFFPNPLQFIPSSFSAPTTSNILCIVSSSIVFTSFSRFLHLFLGFTKLFFFIPTFPGLFPVSPNFPEVFWSRLKFPEKMSVICPRSPVPTWLISRLKMTWKDLGKILKQLNEKTYGRNWVNEVELGINCDNELGSYQLSLPIPFKFSLWFSHVSSQFLLFSVFQDIWQIFPMFVPSSFFLYSLLSLISMSSLSFQSRYWHSVKIRNSFYFSPSGPDFCSNLYMVVSDRTGSRDSFS